MNFMGEILYAEITKVFDHRTFYVDGNKGAGVDVLRILVIIF